MTVQACGEMRSFVCSQQSVGDTVLTLPVAPKALARIKFAPEKSVTRGLSPSGAISTIQDCCEQEISINGVSIDGPGDPLAEIEPVMEVLHFLKQQYQEMPVNLTTIGFNGAVYAQQLKDSGLSSVTIIVNAVDKDTIKGIYSWIRPGRKTVPLAEAAELLMDEQAKAVRAFIDAGCDVNIRTTVYPGHNDEQIESIAETFSAYGVKEMNILSPNSALSNQSHTFHKTDRKSIEEKVENARQYLPVNLTTKDDLPEGLNSTAVSSQCHTNLSCPRASKERPNVAVASLSGMDVDIHIGQASQFLIYGPRDDGLQCLLETRTAPEPGGGENRWNALAEILSDCFVVLTSGAGTKPIKILEAHGLAVTITEDEIEGSVEIYLGGGKKKKGCTI